MSTKATYNKRNVIFEEPELIQKLRQSRTNYDYPVAKLSDFLGDWVVLETFVTDIKTKNSRKDRPVFLLIISTLEDPKDPDSPRGWSKFKVFCGSKRIVDFLMGLRESDLELTSLPLVLRFIAVPFTDRKTGIMKTRYEIDCGLDVIPPTSDPQN